MKAIRCFLFIFLHTVGLAAISQNQRVRFEHLGTDQGLSQSNVICILEDSRGFMWFGTRDGLNKYDGYKFTVYKNDVENKNSLSNNYTPDIFESREGNLWIATWGGGLNNYNREKEKFTSYKHDPQNENSISSDFINSVLEDSQGMVWIGTEDGGLDMFDSKKNKFSHYTYDQKNDKSLGDIFVRNIFEDSKHNLWIGTTNGGLNLFDRQSQTFKRFEHNEKDSLSISSNNVYRIFEDSKHRLWIGTDGGGLNLFIPETGKFRHFKHDQLNKNSLASDVVYAIKEDNEGNLWIGTENGGLSIYNTKSGLFETYDYDEFDNTSLSNNSIGSIYKDSRGNTWVGTFNGGINIVNRDASKFAHYIHNPSKNSLSHNKVLCIYEDAKANIWIGTDGGGLNFFDPGKGTFTYYRHQTGNKNSIAGDYVLGVCEDHNQNLWIGTWGDGITVFNKAKNTYKHFKNDPVNPASLSSNNAWAIFEDREKNIWIGTYGGGLDLYNPDNDSFIRYQYDENNPLSINNNKIHSIFEDNEGNLLLSTDGGGINIFDKRKKTFTHLVHDVKKNSISNNSVGEIYQGRHDILWISTMVGLNSLDRRTNTFTSYTTKDGLPNNTIFGILGDEKHNLWISTNKGISRFNTDTKTFKNFGVADGLQSDEFKENAYCKSRSGSIYFGGNNGFNKFFPDSIKENSFEPPLVITGFQIFNKEVPINDENAVSSPLKNSITETKEITLSYKNYVMSFEFASLNYTVPEKKQYAYKLEGFDNKWNDIGTRHRATYTNLNPGKYTFKVKGLNNDGSWSDNVTSFELTITPPFWLTWWFKTLSILTIVGCFLGFYWRRIRKITNQKAVLEEQVKERTDEVVRQKEELVKNMEELQTAQEQMSKNVKERHDAIVDKAVAQGKFEIASDVMHDIGNAVVGFGSYLTRIRRLQNEDSSDNLRNLAGFFEKEKVALAVSIGEAKADAVVKMLSSMAQTQKTGQEEVNKSITEQLNIVTNIQEILNIQRQYISGHQSRERKVVNLRNVINDSVSMLFASLDKMAIAVSLNITTELPIIKGDRTRLMQAFLNILRNSIEAIDINSPEKNISVNAYINAAQLVLQVKDSGKGFDKPTADQLFKKGFTTKPSGAGLGLYNCRTIIESHEGTIDITSEGKGKGTLATIGFKI